MQASTFLPYIQIVISILLIGSILLQQRGGGISGAFGGGGFGGNVYQTRRGIEKFVFRATIVLSGLLLLTTLLNFLI